MKLSNRNKIKITSDEINDVLDAITVILPSIRHEVATTEDKDRLDELGYVSLLIEGLLNKLLLSMDDPDEDEYEVYDFNDKEMSLFYELLASSQMLKSKHDNQTSS